MIVAYIAISALGSSNLVIWHVPPRISARKELAISGIRGSYHYMLIALCDGCMLNLTPSCIRAGGALTVKTTILCESCYEHYECFRLRAVALIADHRC